MGSDYGDSDPQNFDPDIEPEDIEVGRYAVRTFDLAGGALGSIIKTGHRWEDGACIAKCDVTDHDPPDKDCACGLYGCLSLSGLFGQYPDHAKRMVAVIAAEGVTYIGDLGLRTAAARIAAWWVSDDGDEELCARLCPGARQFINLEVMAGVYGIGGL